MRAVTAEVNSGEILPVIPQKKEFVMCEGEEIIREIQTIYLF